jgi:signal transduction histidine kinase
LKLEQKHQASNLLTFGDPARLQQILWNLLKNAIKFTPNGGEILVSSCNSGGTLILEVKDSGVGISPETLPKIFAAFEQGPSIVTREFGGLGLGLFISHEIAILHDGNLTASR